MNAFSNFISNKVIAFNDKDSPWMTSNLKNKLNWKNSTYKDDLKNGKTNYHYLQPEHAKSQVSVAISWGEYEYRS